MGFSHSWIAVRGATREQAMEALGMEVSNVQTDLLAGVSLFEWPDEWLVVISDDYQNALQGELAQLGRLGASAVAYGADEEALYWVRADTKMDRMSGASQSIRPSRYFGSSDILPKTWIPSSRTPRRRRPRGKICSPRFPAYSRNRSADSRFTAT